MRLIDADKLVSELLGEWVEDFDRVGESEMVSATEQIAEHIKSLETVDAEPVVRCKDCKHSWIDDEYEELRCMNGFVNEDSFCSSGEKRKGRVKKREIVLCRECKFFVIKPFTTPHYLCTFWCDGCETKPEAFCSYGRR